MKRFVALLACIIIISGCMGGKTHNIKLTSEVTPSKVSLDNKEQIRVDVRATNVGTSLEKITADVIKTEGVIIVPPNRTTFSLKKDESRTIIFIAYLTEEAVPGDYIIDVKIETESGDIIWDRAKVRVEQEPGIF
jgi:PBP1b-binding outer membrane lipoprotein LpoB